MPSNVVSAPVDTEFITFGPVHLDVVDRDRSVAWWRDVVGLRLIADQGDFVELGVDGEPLIALRASASSPVRRGYSGLYHLAINLPDEPAFAQTLARLLGTRVPLSTTDHVVAKSIYLGDPNGIGLELTVETPERVRSIHWPSTEPHPEIIDADGRSRQGLEPLDHEQALAKLPDGQLPQSLPTGAKVGHVHLKVADLKVAYSFHRDRLGFLPSNWVPVIGYGDLGTGDFRVHRIAVNTWQGAGAPPRPREVAGMDHFTLRFDSAKAPLVHADLPSAPALAAADEDRATVGIEVTLAERERLLDAKPATPKDDDHGAQPSAVAIGPNLAHHGDDLLDARRVGRVAHPLVAGRSSGVVAGHRRRRTAPPGGVENSGYGHGTLLGSHSGQGLLAYHAQLANPGCISPRIALLSRVGATLRSL